jgi:hypothetical protein
MLRSIWITRDTAVCEDVCFVFNAGMHQDARLVDVEPKACLTLELQEQQRHTS